MNVLIHEYCGEHATSKFDHTNSLRYFISSVPNAFAKWIFWKFWGCLLRNHVDNKNLVDPASSHMLVSKIKPCMSQYKLLHGETANGSLKQLSFIWWSFITWITMVILELIHASKPDFSEGLCLLGTEPTQARLVLWWFMITERIAWLRWRWTIQVSDLSAFDGRVLAYRGNDG